MDAILKSLFSLRFRAGIAVRVGVLGICGLAVLQAPTALGQTALASGRATNTTSATGAICIQPPAGLAHWWSGDGSALDFQGGRSGTTRGTVAYATGKVAEAFSFDGTNGVVEASVPFPEVDGWVLAAWVNWKGASTAAGQKGEAIFYQGNPALDGYGLFIIGTGWCSDFQELCFRGGELGVLYGGVQWFFPEIRLTQNTWVHIGLARSEGVLKLYYNGVLAWARPTVDPHAPTSVFTISRSQPLTFNGSIDEVTLLTSPFDSTGLASIAGAGSAGICKSPSFTGFARPRNGFMSLNTQGEKNKDIILFASPDLRTWESVVRLSNPNGTLTFSVPVNSRSAQKFYRLGIGN